MSRVPVLTRVAPRSPPSRTLRAACGGGLRPSLTAAAPDAQALSGRGEETGPFSRTKKHHRQKPKPLLHSLTDTTDDGLVGAHLRPDLLRPDQLTALLGQAFVRALVAG